jgi:hypothetical protein
MVPSRGGEAMANSWWIVQSAQESLYSPQLPGMPEWGGAPCLCPALSHQEAAELHLCSRRSCRGGAAGCSQWSGSAGVDGGGGQAVCACPQGQAPPQMRMSYLSALHSLLEARFHRLSKPVRTNLAVLTMAFLRVLSTSRSGNGRLSLALLARALATVGTPHAREKRLHRFLKNPRLDYLTVASSLGDILLADREGLCPVIVDQTKSGSAQALVAAVPYAGRALPLACYTFAYPLAELMPTSQNQLEHIFLLEVEESLPPRVTPVWIADRGYARSALLEESASEGRLYIIRGRTGTIITYQSRRMKLRQLKSMPCRAIRYNDVLYHAKRQVRVDVIVYHEPHYKEPWYLLVPATACAVMTTEVVVRLYRERMQIEQSFRDFKTHLGMRGLKLQIDVAARMGRLLLAFCLAYVLCVLIGESPLGQQARVAFEIPRRTPRHGTTRTLSALMIAMVMLSHPDWVQQSLLLLHKLIRDAATGRSWLTHVQNHSPPLNTK